MNNRESKWKKKSWTNFSVFLIYICWNCECTRNSPSNLLASFALALSRFPVCETHQRWTIVDKAEAYKAHLYFLKKILLFMRILIASHDECVAHVARTINVLSRMNCVEMVGREKKEGIFAYFLQTLPKVIFSTLLNFNACKGETSKLIENLSQLKSWSWSWSAKIVKSAHNTVLSSRTSAAVQTFDGISLSSHFKWLSRVCAEECQWPCCNQLSIVTIFFKPFVLSLSYRSSNTHSRFDCSICLIVIIASKLANFRSNPFAKNGFFYELWESPALIQIWARNKNLPNGQ